MRDVSDGYGLARQTDAGSEVASPADSVAFEDAFLRLLERRTAIFTMGDSTSVPTHQAAELLRSICFVLGIDPEEGVVPERLLGVDLEREFCLRLAEVEKKVGTTERLWQDVCVAMPPIPNVALRDTLTGMRDFFRHYDARSTAHDVPCSIDYPLCHPVDESLLGVDFIAEYLRRMMIEARFLARFEIADCRRVLASASPDHVELPVNLYEPVATNAVGLALIGADPARLLVGDAERQAIAVLLGSMGDAGREQALLAAANAVCDAVDMRGEDEREYLRALVPELLPRIEVGLAHGSLHGVFVG